MLKDTFLYLFLLVVTASANTSLWDHVVKMEQVILSVEYNHRHLNVWKENSHGYNRFYVTPLCTLETSSINCTKDEYSNDHRHVFTFYVKLWDSLAAETIKLSLAQKNIEAKVSDILPLPMLMVRLGVNEDVTDRINVNKQWRSNQDRPNAIIFELYTRHEQFCNKMVEDAKSDPENFLTRTKLFLEFSMVVGQQASRSLNITGHTFVKSNFFSKLDNKHSNNDGIVYLTSMDLNKLARDIYRYASAQEEITSTYVESEKESEIISEFLDVIKEQTVHSNELTKEEWNSVFWDDIFSRPDVQTEYFNEVLKYDEGENVFKYNETKDNEFRENIHNKHHREEDKNKKRKHGFSFKGFGFNTGGSKSTNTKYDDENSHNTDINNESTMSLEKIQKHLQKDNVNVKWSGTKFIPKDLLLYRLNTKTLKSSGEVFYKRIVTTKFSSSQKIEIRPEPQKQTKFNYEDIEKKLNNLTENIAKRLTKVEAQINKILGNMMHCEMNIMN